MSFGAPAPDDQQPSEFAFSEENLARARQIIARYPPGKEQSAIIPLLDLAQRQHDNWLPRAAMDYVADLLKVPRIRAYEVASFYTMFNKAPVGRNLIQVCTTTPCWLCGSGEVLKAIDDKLGLKPGDSSDDGQWTVIEVECLGACVNAPMVQVNDDYFEDLSYDRMASLIDQLAKGEAPIIGSQTGRQGSMAEAGPTTMKDQWPSKPATEGELNAQVSAAPYDGPPMPAPSNGADVDEQRVAEETANPKASAEDAKPEDKARPAEKAKALGKQHGSDPKDMPKQGKKGAAKGVTEENQDKAGKSETDGRTKPGKKD
jgi:NADH-quinone oxidoreductase subunit E